MAEIIAFGKPPGGFCETDTARRILKCLQFCQGRGYMGAIVGQPGTGKTRTLQHFADSVPEAWLCTAHRTCATAFGAMQMIADTVGSYFVERGRQAFFSGIVHSVRGRSNGILLIDEAQELSMEALNAIRGIHDATGVAIVFVGNPDVINRFYHRRGQVKPAFEQLESRIAITLRLEPTTPAEVAAFARHHGINDPKAHDFLIEEAKRGGNLRRVERRIAAARLLTSGERAEITLKHLKDASELLGSWG